MGVVRDAFRSAWRKYVTENVASSGVHEPSKEEIWAVGETVEAAIETATAGITVKATWTALDAIDPTRDGQPGRVTGPDAGTHTDPVVGGTVDNIGEYAGSLSPLGWQRVGDVQDVTSLEAEIEEARGGEVDLAAAMALKADLSDLGGVTYQVEIPESEYGFSLSDVNTGQLAAGLRRDGTWYFPKMETASRVSFSIEIEESEWGFSLSDVATGQLALGMRRDGTWVIPKVELPAQSVGVGNLTPELANQVSAGGSSFAQNADYFILGDADESGGYQLTSQRLSDGQTFPLTTENSNTVNAIDSSDIVFFTEFADGETFRKYIPAEGGTAYLTVSRAEISAWGASNTTNEYGSGSGWTTVLASELGRTVNMFGVAGQTSPEIASRQGGRMAQLTVSGNQIPASGPVAITAYSARAVTANGSQTITGTLAGVHGTWTRTGTETHTFTRTVDGSIVACPALTPFIPDVALEHYEDTSIFWIGGNDRDNPAQVIAVAAEMVAYLKPLGKRYLMLASFNSETETIGTTNNDNVLAINASHLSVYGDNFFDQRAWLMDTGAGGAYVHEGITPDSGGFTDTDDIADGIIPARWRHDEIHLNELGKRVIGEKLAEIIIAKGW